MPHSNQYVPRVDSAFSARQYLVACLERDLVGPGWKADGMEPDLNEVLVLDPKTQPSRFYLSGMLLPQVIDEEISNIETDNSTHIDASSEDELPPDMSELEHDGKLSDENKERNRVRSGDGLLTPRSIGMTVHPVAEDGHWEVQISCRWGTYHRQVVSKESVGPVEWHRKDHHFSHTFSSIDFTDDNVINMQLPEQYIRLHIRNESHEVPSLTARLVNDGKFYKSDWAGISDHTMFQAGIHIECLNGLNDVRKKGSSVLEDMDLLYSDSKVLASGHNVGVDWDASSQVAWSRSLPLYEVPLMRSNASLQSFIPTLDELCEPTSLIQSLHNVTPFVNEYQEWLHSQRAIFESQDQREEFIEIFEGHAEKVQASLDRMQSGAAFLLTNEIAREAFRMANQSIRFSQRDPSISDSYRIANFEWRPFQFAFQLLNVEGLLDNSHPDRDILDLAWFPTGGGKTEAYLGLIATVSFFRRLNPETSEREWSNPGISAIMRYTLRLLTADQAGRLIRLCGAMNTIWNSDSNNSLGFSDFTVGMWIGSNSSPNKFFSNPDYPSSRSTTVQDILDLDNNQEELPESSFIQFTTCPWCGDSSVGNVSNWRIVDVHTEHGLLPKLRGHCSGQSCIFGDAIPFSCVDEDLYLHPPTILLGTVDKMVQLAHNKHSKTLRHGTSSNGENYEVVESLNSRRMFGFSSEGPLPPDLIIQDELHLLSGPLGTLAGMIETALTTAWSHQGHKPKYVAATATIRGASRDIGLIYGCELNVFPPPLLSAKDNFFAQEQPVTESSPGRIHVGLLAPPRRSRSATNQPAASLLQSVYNLQNAGVDEQILDPYWTMVMYYNSLRELGGGQSALRENIPRWMSQYATSSISEVRNLAEGGDVELTSRKSAAELALSRQRLNIELGTDPRYVVDVLSTSTMFQVGVDIPRLGLMTIVGQPRSNSEYIQSSGRVGRKSSKPGLVLSVLRGTYPRDQSHYEHFRSFHQEFYRHVDFTSVTPFTHRALDRGFASSLMLLLRMGVEQLSRSSDLDNLRGNHVRSEALQLVEGFTNVVRSRQEILEDSNQEHTDAAIHIIEEEWDRLCRLIEFSDSPVWWIIWNDNEVRGRDPVPISWMRSSFRLTDPVYPGDLVDGLTSLRDVASEVQMKSVRGYDFMTMPEGHLMSHMAPGNIWEKGGIPYMTLGISRWDNTLKTGYDQRTNGSEAMNSPNDVTFPGLRIEEPSLTTILGHDKALRLLPKASDSGNALGNHGAVTFQKYPWVFICDEHGHIQSRETWNHELQHHICSHKNCSSKTRPSRFISLCVDGHMSPFDYWFWVHSGRDNQCRDRNNMRLELGNDAALTLSNWVVHCDSCHQSRNMLQVPWVTTDDRHDSPPCRSRREWLASGAEGNDEECSHRMVHRQVGNTSVTMNEGGSIMIIPPHVGWNFVDHSMMNRLSYSESIEHFSEGWHDDVERNHHSIIPYLERLRGSSFDHDGTIDHNSVIQQLWSYYQQHSGDQILTIQNLRRRERMGLITEDGNSYNREQFVANIVAGGFEDQPESWTQESWPLRSANQVHRLTELRYIDGIRRLENDPNKGNSQPIDLPEVRPRPGPEEQFGISMYNHGEGLFFDIKPSWLHKQVLKRNILSIEHANMELSYNRLMNSMTQQIPSLDDVQNRSGFTILHTLSHALIKSLSETSGFSLGSVRERLYYHCEEGEIIEAGILLYTSAPSSDGTLGGLVQQGSTIERIENIIQRALHSLNSCSNDPICGEHLPTADETNGSACHTCVLLPETSCEFANHMLDRNWG